jgi:hypothetical protein
MTETKVAWLILPADQIKEEHSYGKLQHPLVNTSRLVRWIRDGLMLTEDAYRSFYHKNTSNLEKQGFISLSAVNKTLPKEFRYTNYIDSQGVLLLTKEYTRLNNLIARLNAKQGTKTTTAEYVNSLGYYSLLEQKKQPEEDKIHANANCCN